MGTKMSISGYMIKFSPIGTLTEQAIINTDITFDQSSPAGIFSK